MTPSLNKCPRCGTLRPSGEVAHTCVVVAPDHEAAASWAKKIPKQATVSMDDENLSRAYLDAMARLDKATELLERSLDVFREWSIWGTLNSDIHAFLDERK